MEFTYCHICQIYYFIIKFRFFITPYNVSRKCTHIITARSNFCFMSYYYIFLWIRAMGGKRKLGTSFFFFPLFQKRVPLQKRLEYQRKYNSLQYNHNFPNPIIMESLSNLLGDWLFYWTLAFLWYRWSKDLNPHLIT